MKIAHLSDLQVPRVAAGRLEHLADAVNKAEPELVIVTGDLTQRAKADEFRTVRSFLDLIDFPLLVLPGNHDIPFYRFFERFAAGFKNYKKIISKDPEPAIEMDGLAAAGINTARALVLKGGRINPLQVKNACDFLLEKKGLRVVASHHPLDLPPHYNRSQTALGSWYARRRFGQCQVDLFLSGHYHVSTAVDRQTGFGNYKYRSVFAQAGTVSERMRGEPISYNVIDTNGKEMKIRSYHLSPENIIYPAQEHIFRKEEGGWVRKL